jgi:hypothetical protein
MRIDGWMDPRDLGISRGYGTRAKPRGRRKEKEGQKLAHACV